MKLRRRIGDALAGLAGRVASTTYEPWDDFWYGDHPGFGPGTVSGVRVNPETAQRLTVANACRRIISSTVAMLPARVYERLPNGRRRLAEEHPIDRLLHKRPNGFQTPHEFKMEVADTLAARGNFYAEKIPDRRTRAAELWPIHPDHLKVDWQNRRTGRRRVYDISSQHDGKPRVLSDRQVWHPHLLSLDGGLTGASPIGLNAEGIGFALGSQNYAASFFKNGARMAGFIAPGESLSKQQAEQVEETLAARSGSDAAHATPVFRIPLKFERVSIGPKDTQLLEVLGHGVAGTARIWGIPLWMLQAEEKDTAWGTGMETIGQGFKTFTVMPYFVAIEESVETWLLDDPDRYFVEFKADALNRADLKSRYEAYSLAVNSNNPWLHRDDIRGTENLDPTDQPGGQEFVRPTNNVGGDSGVAAPQNGQNGAMKGAAHA